MKIVRRLAVAFVWLILSALTVWAGAALYFDAPAPALRLPLAVAYWIFALAVVVWAPRRLNKALLAAGCGIVMWWWFGLQPSSTRNWQPDVMETAWMEQVGDRITVHNVRNVDYRTETDFTPRWETRVVDLSQLRALDIFITFWGSEWIAHPILSFQFGDNDHIAFSIETRKEVGEEYSAIRGFFRQYELTYVVADERDVVRLRTNFRKGEDVFLYRVRETPERIREAFFAYMEHTNRLHQRPEWYNALTNNCTTRIRRDAAATDMRVRPWDWRILANGHMDEMLYERGQLAAALAFPELKKRAHINPIANAVGDAPDFSRRIRESVSRDWLK